MSAVGSMRGSRLLRTVITMGRHGRKWRNTDQLGCAWVCIIYKIYNVINTHTMLPTGLPRPTEGACFCKTSEVTVKNVKNKTVFYGDTTQCRRPGMRPGSPTTQQNRIRIARLTVDRVPLLSSGFHRFKRVIFGCLQADEYTSSAQPAAAVNWHTDPSSK
jgi:hypothetical protein